MNSEHSSAAQHLPESATLKNFHIVLVRPFDNGNIGATARAMLNLGFSNLHLVAPVQYDPERAAKAACWAAALLEGAKIHPSLETALAPMENVVGFSCRSSQDRRAHVLLPDWLCQLKTPQLVPTALVFGPERDGLGNEETALCRQLIRIPSTAANPSYNLAQAVLLVLWELQRAFGDTPLSDAERTSLPNGGRQPASWNEFTQLDRIVNEVLEASEFYRPDSPPAVQRIITNLFRRTIPDQREMGILLAMFGHLRTTLRRLSRK